MGLIECAFDRGTQDVNTENEKSKASLDNT